MTTQRMALPPARRRAWITLALAGGAGLAGAWWLQPRAATKPTALPEDDVCVVAPLTPYDAASGLSPMAARSVPTDARCPVCGMYPARFPGWAAQVIFANGDAQFFDSPLSLLRYLERVPAYVPGRSAADIVAHYVTDVDSGRWTGAQAAFYVHGSSARGPMRAGNLPAFTECQAAKRFAAQRGGQVLAFGEIDAALVAALMGTGGHQHAAR